MVSQVSGDLGEVLVALILEQGDGDISEGRQCSWGLAVSGLALIILKSCVLFPSVQPCILCPSGREPNQPTAPG